MRRYQGTDYDTYREIMDDLICPIAAKDLDDDTLVRLYHSKLVYLENLRQKCFWEMNSLLSSPFGIADYQLILDAIQKNKHHLRNVMLLAISSNIANRKVV